jgi:hypothetical protein
MKLSGLFARRLAAKTLAARSPVDIALFGAGVTTAAASVVFAATMFARSDNTPLVNGMQYLGVFGQPHGHAAIVAAAEPAPARVAPPAPAAAGTAASRIADAGAAAPARADSHQSIDMSPTGSISHGDANADADPYRLVAVEPGMAWLRNSVETRVVKPGDFAPGLGRVAAIVEREGRWTLLDDSGAVLIAADPAASAGVAVNPFSRRMIFGGD